jgi:hypothetical protein
MGNPVCHPSIEGTQHSGHSQQRCRVLRTKTAPRVVETESAYRNLDATGASGMRCVRDQRCFSRAAGSFKEGRAA